MRWLVTAFWICMWICFPWIMGACWIGSFCWGCFKAHYDKQQEILEELQRLNCKD